MEWDDVRIFLALVRAGSVRAAAPIVGVSHSTVARRVEAFETRLGVKLFDRVSSGYNLTVAGEDLLEVAEGVENELDAVQRRLVGQDRRLSGVIRVTMVDVIATHLLMPDLARFSELYPDIELDVVITYEALDLTRREADIAIRFVENPPEHLIGRRLAGVASTAYASEEYIKQHDLDDPAAVSWIGYGSSARFPNWVKQSDYPHIPAKGCFDSMLLQLEATRCGMGIGNLLCFLGDPEPTLRRLSLEKPRVDYDLWLLRHRDTRSTARLRVFSDFITDAVDRYRPLLEGLGT